MTTENAPARKRRIAAGTLSLVAARATSGLATLLATPVLFSRLGPKAFGVWTVLVGAAAIATYADAGLSSALLRETAGAHTSEGARRRARGALALAMVIPTAIGIALAAGVVASWSLVAAGLQLGTPAHPAEAAALILIAGFVVDGWGGAGRAVLEGTGRIPRAAMVTATTSVLAAALGVVAVLDGFGLVGLAAATLIGATARAAVLTAIARRVEPQLTPCARSLSRGDLKALCRYGAAVQVSRAGGAVNAESDRLVVAGVAGVAPAGGLDLGLRLTNLVGLVPFCSLYAMFPALARHAADGDREALDALYIRASRFVALAALIPAALLMTSASPAVVAWIGHPFAFAATCVVVLCPAAAIASLTGVASALCRAEGKPGRETRFVVSVAAANIVLTAPLAAALGPIGVPTATAIATTLGSVRFLWMFHRATDRPLTTLADALAGPLVAALAGGAAAVAAGHVVPVGAGRLDAAIAIAARAAAGSLAAGAALATIGLLRRNPSAIAAAEDTGMALATTRPEWAVFLSAIRWEGPRNRQHELATQLAAGRRVLFVEAPGLRPAWALRVDALTESIWRAQPLALLPLGRFVPFVNRVNRRYAAWRLRGWLSRKPGDRVIVVDEDLAAPLAARLGGRLVVYDAADLDWTFTRAWNRRHLRTAQAEALRRANLVLTSSPVLAEHLPPFSAPVVELLNACDADHFERGSAVVPELAALPRPLIGYVGAVDRRAFDASLVEAVGREHPEWSIVLAGPIDPRVGARFADLANVHLIGPVAYEMLPSLIRGFDVCVIPYRVGDRIDYVQPKKLFEYLAVGKPVVATPLPALARLAAPCRVAADANGFSQAIAAALRELGAESAELRRRCARANTWGQRGVTLRSLLDGIEVAA